MSVISFKNVVFHYSKEENILNDVSFDIMKGSTTAVLGKNGSGKSTLLKLLMNFEKPQSGVIELNGELITSFSILERSRQIAYVGQDIFNQFDFSVEDYLLFGVTNSLSMFESPKEKHKEIVKINVDKFKIRHLLKKRMDQISGGEKQIIMICKAFIQGSKIIVLDEPLSALDFTNQNTILKLLKEIKKEDKTIIFSTHNPNHALYLDSNVLLIDKSKIIINGNARADLTLEKLTNIYGETIGYSNEHGYSEFSIKNDEI